MRRLVLAWLAKKLAPYLAPLIAAEVARQLVRERPSTQSESPKRRYIGE